MGRGRGRERRREWEGVGRERGAGRGRGRERRREWEGVGRERGAGRGRGRERGELGHLAIDREHSTRRCLCRSHLLHHDRVCLFHIREDSGSNVL